MAKDRNKTDRLGGQFMIQDRDHMSEVGQMGDDAKHGGGPQFDQSPSRSRQQGGGQKLRQRPARWRAEL